MSDAFIFRLLIVVCAIVIIFALVAQYNKTKAVSSTDRGIQGVPKAVQEGFQQAPTPTTGLVPAPASSPVHAPSAHVNAASRTAISPPPAPALKDLVNTDPALKDLVNTDPAPFESLDTEMYRAIEYKPADNKKPQPDPFPRERLTKDDLLPKDAANTKWAQVNPAGQGDLENVNLLDAGWNFGIDTQGQTLKNPNLQIRSEFPNPKADVGPWQQSTIENDCSRRYFEIGEP